MFYLRLHFILGDADTHPWQLKMPHTWPDFEIILNNYFQLLLTITLFKHFLKTKQLKK